MASQKFELVSIVGARPQFIKAGTVSRAIEKFNQRSGNLFIEEQIIHTGQHYDDNMSKVFFDELDIPKPTVNLDVGSAGHGRQTGEMLARLETVLIGAKPDWVIIYGDTNSTLAGALAAAKLHIPIAHVEAGLRSFNRTMPEEINRVVVDHVSTLLFCPTDTAVSNLAREGITKGVYNVGDVMYDSLLFYTSLAENRSNILNHLGLKPKSFYLVTVHRPENTDNLSRLEGIFETFKHYKASIVFPIHPRTRNRLEKRIEELADNLRLIDPLAYLDMLMLERNARIVLTDSGGVQKEAYWFDVPCITLRNETEWVELTDLGINRVVGADPKSILAALASFESDERACFDGRLKGLYGDGDSAGKIVNILVNHDTAC